MWLNFLNGEFKCLHWGCIWGSNLACLDYELVLWPLWQHAPLLPFFHLMQVFYDLETCYFLARMSGNHTWCCDVLFIVSRHSAVSRWLLHYIDRNCKSSCPFLNIYANTNLYCVFVLASRRDDDLYKCSTTSLISCHRSYFLHFTCLDIGIIWN